jgi:phosphoribosylamine--glycine ligase
VFHAGTAIKNGELVTSGGRVLAVCALGENAEAARGVAYAAIDRIEFRGKHCRRDIPVR